MADMMKRGLLWQAGKIQAHNGRTVTYMGIRNGSLRSASLICGLGTSQLTQINMLGMQPGQDSYTLADPIEVDRDYIVVIQDMRDVGLWPPDSGDFIDDTHDEDGVTKRYQVKSVPSQSPMRLLRGSYDIMARVHTKFFSEVATYWSDTFEDDNGVLLTNHDPEIGTGGYGGGTGTIIFQNNRIVASTVDAFHYFQPGETGTVSHCTFRFNVLAADLDDKFSELGLGVRCASSGSGQRDGTYCTVKIGYDGATQTRQLRIVRRRNGANTTLTAINLQDPISLVTTYKLSIANTDGKVLMTLSDETGSVAIASLGHESTIHNDLTGQAVWFAHTLTVPTGPWIDNVIVEAP